MTTIKIDSGHHAQGRWRLDGDAQRIGQMVWMLFLKIFDDREAEAELMEDAYVSSISEGQGNDSCQNRFKLKGSHGNSNSMSTMPETASVS